MTETQQESPASSEQVNTRKNSGSENDGYLVFDNLPNRITLFRIALIPVVMSCLIIIHLGILEKWHVHLGWIAGWTFVLASVTDGLDGYIARKRNIVTVFGSFLDPIADKFLVISCLIMLLVLQRVHFAIVIILTLRELYITSLRLLAQSEGISVPVDRWGKWKTAAQMAGIPMLMANAPLLGIPFRLVGPILLYIASFLSAYSAFNYTVKSLASLKQKRRDKILQKKRGKEINSQHPDSTEGNRNE